MAQAMSGAEHNRSLADAVARRRRLEEERRDAETVCRAALNGQPRLLRRFEALLALAQRYAVIREEQAGWFTLGWPLLRRAVLRLGETLCDRGVIAQVEDVFYLKRSELDVGLDHQLADMRVTVASRRLEWERQRRLSPPLTLGKALGESLIAGAADDMRMPGAASRSKPNMLKGMPASPGRATGPVRVVYVSDDFARFQAGEVLVAQVTTPAWTPLFERAAAVVTDGGSVAAHASLVAREYGIPAVVGTGDATARLHDGQLVTVDGGSGVVEVHP
jgi:pyruvate,water dikinase